MSEYYEKLAINLSHFVYRNTEIEDYHSENAVMDGDFYNVIHEIVEHKIRLVLEFQPIVFKTNSLTDLSTIIKDLDKKQVKGLYDYLLNLQFNNHMGTDWDKPILLDVEIADDYSDFLLNGHFRECCNENRKLNDETMKYINKDICNRIYTLLCRGYIK